MKQGTRGQKSRGETLTVTRTWFEEGAEGMETGK